MRWSLSLSFIVAGALASCQVNVKPSRGGPEDHGQHDDDKNGTDTDADTSALAASAEAPTARPTATATTTPAPTAKICTEVGCLNGLVVDVSAGRSGFGKGRYEIDVVADGKKAKCELAIPLVACDKGPSAKCTGDVKLSIGEAGCALDPKEQGISTIAIEGSPAAVEITVKRAGKKIGAAKLTPAYKTLQPNGPDCPPTCKSGKETLSIQ